MSLVVSLVRRFAILCVVVTAALVLSGCVSVATVANKMVAAPNHEYGTSGNSPFAIITSAFFAKQFMVPVGPPPATLAVAVIAPRSYDFSASQTWQKHHESMMLAWQVHGGTTPVLPAASGKKAATYIHASIASAMQKLPICHAVGTVVLLPGYGESKASVLGYALDFANHGYRVVLVDLRGQGQSTGKFVTFGVIEHHDISQVIAALGKRGLIAGKLALVGVSEGAAISLETAAIDHKVDAVVAIAPFVDLKHAMRVLVSSQHPILSHGISKSKLNRAFALAGQKVHKNLSKANPGQWVGQIQAPVLYVAGGGDKVAPAIQVKSLAQSTPHAHYVEIPGYPHPAMYLGVSKIAPHALKMLAQTIGRPKMQNLACLTAPPKKDVSYRFHARFTIPSKFFTNND